MTLRERWDSALRMGFDFRRDDRLVARGEQTVASLRRVGSGVEPVPVPEELVAALAPYEVARRARWRSAGGPGGRAGIGVRSGNRRVVGRLGLPLIPGERPGDGRQG